MFEQYELEKLATVKEEILSQVNELGTGLAKKRDEVIESRKEMWQEARRAIRDFDDVADLYIFAEEVSSQERGYSETSKLIYKLKKMMGEPYFALIDFTEEGESKVEEIYIGHYSLFCEETRTFHIYDWRAPISSLYYDYGVGHASFNVPATNATIHGDISLKRQYQIEKGELLYLFDNDLAIDDEILRRELSKATDAHIKTIVNTIQTEQNKAIRASSPNILVYGPAGSGKTSVGLHRLAYLLYRDRKTLSSSKLRIFSPSPVFASYIAGIIPELGEDDVQNLDFGTLIRTKGKERRPFYSMYEQIEHVVARPDSHRTQLLSIKYSPDFLNQLEEYVMSYSPQFEAVRFNTDILCTTKRLEEIYRDRTKSSTLKSKTDRIIAYVERLYDEYYKANRRAISELFDDIHRENFSEREVRIKYEEEKNIVIRDLKNSLNPRASKLLEKFLRSKENFANAIAPLKAEKLYYEDALLIFYISILTGQILPDKTVKHILIDEAQDLGHVHHRILAKLYGTSHFTVLADANQALYNGISLSNIKEIQELYPTAQNIQLNKSYRSTFEINNFASQFLPVNSYNDDASYMRHGKEPEIVTVPNPDSVFEAILQILQHMPESYNTLGILLPTAASAKAFYKKMVNYYPKNNPFRPLKFIANEDTDFSAGVMVMAVPFAKGLEFDAVICPEYGSPSFEGELGQRLMYLICTRALHELYLINVAN